MEKLIAGLFLLVFVASGLCLVWQANANDDKLIKACSKSRTCINPFTSEGLIE